LIAEIIFVQFIEDFETKHLIAQQSACSLSVAVFKNLGFETVLCFRTLSAKNILNGVFSKNVFYTFLPII